MSLLDKDTVIANHASVYSTRQSNKALKDTFGLHDCTGKDDCYIELEMAIMYVFRNVGTGDLTELEINNILSILS